ncbi:MAG TPA: hypothetical protein VGF30_06665 [Bacteroidia bacterium]
MKPATKAILIISAMIMLAFAGVIFFTDHPVLNRKKTNEKYGAIAIRDHVIPFQKYGTRLFSLPYLNNYYSEVNYFTENYNGENKTAFISSLQQLLLSHDSVDIYLLAHSNAYYTWIQEIDKEQRAKIRLVYNTGCSGSYQSYYWKELGIKYYVAHESNQSISPVFYFYFLRRYTNGYSLTEAIDESNAAMHKQLDRIKMISFGNLSVDEKTEFDSEGKLVMQQ